MSCLAYNSEDTAQEQAKVGELGQGTATTCEEQGQVLRPLKAVPTTVTWGDGGDRHISVWLLLSQDNADITKGRIWCRENTTLRNTYLGPVLSGGQGSQVRTGKGRGKGLSRQGPNSSCSHPNPTKLRPSPPTLPDPVTLVGVARVRALRILLLQQAGSSGHEPSPSRRPHLPRQIRPSCQSVSCCGWFCSVVNSSQDGRRARTREQGGGWKRPWTHSSR